MARLPAQRGGAWVGTLRVGVGASITNAVRPSRFALIRPGLRPAHLPPQGKALTYPVWPIVEKYRSNYPSVA